MTDEHNHCRDCCCARSWKALGITAYTGRAIPEHIEDAMQALSGLIGLVQLLSRNEDIPAEIRARMTENHRFKDAQACFPNTDWSEYGLSFPGHDVSCDAYGIGGSPRDKPCTCFAAQRGTEHGG